MRKKFPNLNIQVDGGIDPDTIGVSLNRYHLLKFGILIFVFFLSVVIQTAAKAGANVVVAGSSLFKPGVNPADTIKLFRKAIDG